LFSFVAALKILELKKSLVILSFNQPFRITSNQNTSYSTLAKIRKIVSQESKLLSK
jgi:hypothetical protein